MPTFGLRPKFIAEACLLKLPIVLDIILDPNALLLLISYKFDSIACFANLYEFVSLPIFTLPVALLYFLLAI
jgi:hypothetical protein